MFMDSMNPGSRFWAESGQHPVIARQSQSHENRRVRTSLLEDDSRQRQYLAPKGGLGESAFTSLGIEETRLWLVLYGGRRDDRKGGVGTCSAGLLSRS